MDASVALWAVVVASALGLSAAGAAVWLALTVGNLRGKLADGSIKLADEARDRDVAIARAEKYLADLDDYRRRAQAELANLRADLERESVAPPPSDPAVRRARWGKLLQQTDNVSGMLERAAAAGADAPHVLRGVDGVTPAPQPAGGGAAGPGGGKPAA